MEHKKKDSEEGGKKLISLNGNFMLILVKTELN